MLIVDSIQDVQDMARGAVLLSTGGGGDPYIGELLVSAQIKRGRHPKIVSCEEIADDAFVLCIAGFGAPTPILEYMLSEKVMLRLLAEAETFYGRRIDALICMEIGGANSMMPLAAAASSGIPLLDADGMGRAFPQLEMTTFSIKGCRVTPCILMDEAGNVITVKATNDRMAEELCRAITGPLGGGAYSAAYPMTGKQARECSIQRTVSQALEIGRCIREAREGSADVFADLIRRLSSRDGRVARILFDGKIVDVIHEIRDGWRWGQATLRALNGSPDVCTVEIRNEFIVARINGETAAIVPDLISILDRESGEPLTADMLAYGQRVKVLGYGADPMLCSPESLEVVGPRRFGLDEDFRPLARQ